MNDVDLTPAMYRNRMRFQHARLIWIAAVCACALLAFVPVFLEQTRVVDPAAAQARERLAQSERRLTQSKSMIASLTTQLKIYQREMSAVDHLTQRPDWSDALGRIAVQFDGGLMMTGCRLGSAQDSKLRGDLRRLVADAPDDSVWLMINGLAENNAEVPGLMVRLESLGLFERVVMAGTKREPYAGGSRTAFSLLCRVD